MKPYVSPHAVERAMQRFHVKQENAAKWIRKQYEKATYVADVINAKGEEGRLFASGNVALILHPKKDCVLTVMHLQHPPQKMKLRVLDFLREELRALELREIETERQVSEIREGVADFRTNIERRMKRTRSIATKLACQAVLNGVAEYLTQIEDDVRTVKLEKKAVAKALVAYM
jgi:hypothetical protein